MTTIYYHVQVKEERRQSPEHAKAIECNGKLHSIGKRLDENFATDPQIEYAASWDGVAPYIELYKGKVADVDMFFLGWPTITKTEWEAANPPV
jgi:hypothetical protein